MAKPSAEPLLDCQENPFENYSHKMLLIHPGVSGLRISASLVTAYILKYIIKKLFIYISH